MIGLLWIDASEASSDKASESITGKKIAMIIPFIHYDSMELNPPKEMFETEGAIVTIVSSEIGSATGTLGAKIEVDVVIEELNVADFDAILFIGGMGVLKYLNDPAAHEIARQAIEQNKVLAANGWAPQILANAGVMQGKRATVYSGGSARLEQKGCIYFPDPVVVDGNIITAKGPPEAEEFAREIITALSSM
jgi:protease I